MYRRALGIIMALAMPAVGGVVSTVSVSCNGVTVTNATSASVTCGNTLLQANATAIGLGGGISVGVVASTMTSAMPFPIGFAATAEVTSEYWLTIYGGTGTAFLHREFGGVSATASSVAQCINPLSSFCSSAIGYAAAKETPAPFIVSSAEGDDATGQGFPSTFTFGQPIRLIDFVTASVSGGSTSRYLSAGSSLALGAFGVPGAPVISLPGGGLPFAISPGSGYTYTLALNSPEPASMLLFLGGCCVAAYLRRRRRRN